MLTSPDPVALARDAADRIAEASRAAIAARGAFHLALSGGATPRAAYAALAEPEAAARVDWPRVHLWWSDERDVPAGHPDSNYRMAREALISRVPIPPANVHRVETERGPRQAAAHYELAIESLGHWAIEPMAQWPNGPMAQSPFRFDLILLGLGEDGHTASLFPGTTGAIAPEQRVAALYVPKLNAWRITFTPRLINAARQAAFLVSGAAKADVARRVLRGPRQPDVLPAQAIQLADGSLEWWADRAALPDNP
jgi:6-phosphogluconolactonase